MNKKEKQAWRTIVAILQETGYDKLYDEEVRVVAECLCRYEQRIKKQKEVIDKATNELFILKDMIYKPETREENFEIKRKISSIIKRLNGKEVSE